MKFLKIDTNKSLDLVAKYLENLSKNKNERNELYKFIIQNSDQFLEISERMVGEVKKITFPNSWKGDGGDDDVFNSLENNEKHR